MKAIETLKNLRFLTLLFAAILVVSCSDDDDNPPEENIPEVFTDVTLVFTPTGGGTTVRATAEDPDGEGIADLMVNDEITLAANTTYTLTLEILNDLPDPDEDIGDEIAEEDDEHQFFFAFTDGAFSDPTGDGNIGASNAADPINYMDEDSDAQDGSGNPVGLVTEWTTGDAQSGASFTINLQHQPDVKTATSTSEDGDTDFDLTFVLNIE
ncbi:GTP cyclohydrolase [Ulvibacterium sp.]|uniref:GTP cyclohydrolase n=1 Tax=Ulvibacterium sp. TaxID=2665914 RepID=UPI00261F95BF|nr:GTP cyclohydrolase [Ulvibacterium sp.]